MLMTKCQLVLYLKHVIMTKIFGLVLSAKTKAMVEKSRVCLRNQQFRSPELNQDSGNPKPNEVKGKKGLEPK